MTLEAKTIKIELRAVPEFEIDTDDLAIQFFDKWDSPIKFYDNSWGKFFIFRDTGGIVGIVRARTWEDAYEIVEDEFLPVVALEDIHECYDLTREEYEKKTHAERNETGDWPDLIEGYSYQSNATGSGIVSHDLNGECLDALTPELIEHLEIKIVLVVSK